MRHSNKSATLVAALLASSALAGCFGSDNDTPPPPPVVIVPPPVTPPPPPPPPTGSADEFGAGFATAFRASADSDPVDPVTGDTIPINKFADPTDIPNP